VTGRICVADVVAEQVRWLWPGRIPVGKIVTLDGDPGLGKSALGLTMAATVSRGGGLAGRHPLRSCG
jgi:KaiC/GvpD/RAD55 family RecA-like ATPase